jgi:carbamoyltransferase
MKILGLASKPNRRFSHDGSAALIVDNKIVYAIEQERLSRNRYAMGEGARDAAKACLQHIGLQLSEIDHIAYSWNQDLISAKKLTEEINITDELTQLLLPPEQFGYAEPPLIHCIQHHYSHAAASYYTSGFDHAAVLVIDGKGESDSISLYHARGTKIELIESYPYAYSLGEFYFIAGRYAGLGGPTGHSGPGKLMGLAPFGQVRQEVGFSFDADTGRFTLPALVQEAVDGCTPSLIERDLGKFWRNFFERNFYPYSIEDEKPSAAYDIMHYVDMAAAVQQTLENISCALANRIKKLTGEKNLIIVGGCALNCSMNAHLSRQRIFENIYVFPGANDAGCSIGAALALSYTLNPSAPMQPRLEAPAFGQAYTEEEIAAAIQAYGFVPEKLFPAELAERVASDLVNDKIVAWFRGKDEFGPRALGRRSFLANPARRETLGRLNKIKGREMWRPLAPSILDEHAETVLEGSMERGLHRYMLGVASVRAEWRAKIPAVVHIDFTCRPHFVQAETDGAYWEVINKFYEKTDIPLVCNTSLNVAGQPIVHKLEEVLSVFANQDDVQTLVIENFYLTKAPEQ